MIAALLLIGVFVAAFSCIMDYEGNGGYDEYGDYMMYSNDEEDDEY